MAFHNDYDGLHVRAMENIPNSNQQTHISQNHQQPLLPSPFPSGPYPVESKLPLESKSHRNPWDLSPFVFAALIALITAIVVGGAVGGAVATTKSTPASPSSTCKNTTSTSSASTSGSTTAPTGTFTNYIPPQPSNVQSLYTDCVSLDGSRFQSQQGQGPIFQLTCPQAIIGSAGVGGVTLMELVAYTLEDCIDACVLMNVWRQSQVCSSVTWDSGMAGSIALNSGGNCWLFNNSSAIQVKANSTSARIQS